MGELPAVWPHVVGFSQKNRTLWTRLLKKREISSYRDPTKLGFWGIVYYNYINKEPFSNY